MGPNAGGGRRNKADAANRSTRARFSNWTPASKSKRGGRGGRGGPGGSGRGGDSGARGAGSGGREEGGRGGGGREGGRPTDASVIQKLAERVSSGVTSGVATGGSGGSGKDPLKGVDVAGLEEINIAEKDWQSIFRLLKDIGLFDAAASSQNSPAEAGGGPAASATESDTKSRRSIQDDDVSSTVVGGARRGKGQEGMPEDDRGEPLPPAGDVDVEAWGGSSPPGTSASFDPSIMAYLTEHLAFPAADAARAMASTSGADLGEALDYLCLHTDEAGLKAAFRARGKGARGGSPGIRRKGGELPLIAPASTIEVASSADWKLEHRLLSLAKMGFPRKEAELALRSSTSGEVMAHDTLCRLLGTFRVGGDSEDRPSEQTEEPSVRDEEAEALQAIFGEEAFRVIGDESKGEGLRWELDAALEFDGGGITPETTIGVVFEAKRRYPHEAPLILVSNESLPPGLARKLMEEVNTRAAKIAGSGPIVYDLVTWLQGASRALHVGFKRDTAAKEEQLAAEKRKSASGRGKKDPKSARGTRKEEDKWASASSKGAPTVGFVDRTLDRQERERTDEEALRGRGTGYDAAAWRVEYLKALNEGLTGEKARAEADRATGRTAAPPPPPPPPPVDGDASKAGTPPKTSEEFRAAKQKGKGEDGAPMGRKPFLARMEGKEDSSGGDGGEGRAGESGISVEDGLALAAADGYKPSLYLREVIDVLEETKTNQPWLRSQETKDLPLPPLAHAVDQAMQPQPGQDRRSKLQDGEGGGCGQRDEADKESLLAQQRALSASLAREFEKKKRTRAYQDMLGKRSKLPAFEMRAHIVDMVQKHQAVVVSGETGCGKTTQVPQLVLDKMIEEGEGASANVIVTQPRRISAIGVAERIAAERTEKLGETAGYQIRLEAKRSNATRLLLCTTGILLRRLQVDPWLASVSHVFVDEVHERNLDTDFLLIILKGLLAKRPGLKLVLMSATLNAALFSEFFGGAPVVEIPGRAHPVTPFFLEDVLERTGYVVDPMGEFAFKGFRGGGGGAGGRGAATGKRWGEKKPEGAGAGGFSNAGRGRDGGGRGGGGRGSGRGGPPRYGYGAHKPEGSGGSGGGAGDGVGGGGASGGRGAEMRPTADEIARRYGRYSEHVRESLLVVDESIINYEAISGLLEYITLNFEEGAILVFLPGLAEITTMLEVLAENPLFNDKGKTRVYPLHGSLSTADQKAIFDVPPPGVRKIVVSTNIAETSITIEDCVFVVDSCRVKENRFDDVNMMPMLLECWVSKASAKQRRGRAGRVRPGVCFHMCSSGTFQDVLSEFQLPEMLRVSLDDMVLQILLLDKGDPAEFLSLAVNPPTKLAVSNSLKYLRELQATQLDEHKKPVLTALGFHLATLPVEPRIGKMMLYGAIFGCVGPAVTIAAAMSCRNPFVAPFDKREIADDARRNFALALSDHLTLLKAYDVWKLARGCGQRAEREYLRDRFLSRQTLVMVEDMRRQFRGLLRDIGFIEGAGRASMVDDADASNANGGNVQLIKAVVCAGLYPNVTVAPAAICPPPKSGKAGPGEGKGAVAHKTVGEVSLQGRKGAMYLHPVAVNFDKKRLDSRYGVYHEVVKTSKVYIRDMTTVTPLMLALFGGTLHVHHEREVITVDRWLHFRAARRAATLIKYLRVHMERLLLRKITHPQEDMSSNGRDIIQAVSMLLRSGARQSGAQQEYSPEMLAAEINGVRAGSSGAGSGNGQGRQRDQEQKQLRVMQRRGEDDAVRRSAMPAGGIREHHHGEAGSEYVGDGVPEEELFAPLNVGPVVTDTPVAIPTLTGGGGGGMGGTAVPRSGSDREMHRDGGRGKQGGRRVGSSGRGGRGAGGEGDAGRRVGGGEKGWRGGDGPRGRGRGGRGRGRGRRP